MGKEGQTDRVVESGQREEFWAKSKPPRVLGTGSQNRFPKLVPKTYYIRLGTGTSLFDRLRAGIR